MADKEKNNSKKWYLLLLLLLLLITVASVTVSVVTVLRGSEKKPPDYLLPPDDTNAETMGGETPDDTMAPPSEGGSAISIHYSDKISISLASGKATMRLGNPKKSLASMSASIIVQNVVIFESGLLRPGYVLRETDIPQEKLAMLSEGKYNGIFRLSFYDESGEKSIVQSEIPVEITVKA